MTTQRTAPSPRRQLKIGHRVTTMHLALPASLARAGVIVLHPWWGLNDDVIGFADRLAEAGFAVAAPDLFAGQIATTIPEAEGLSDSVDEDVADAFVLAAVDELGAVIGDPTARIGVVGFSFGAAWRSVRRCMASPRSIGTWGPPIEPSSPSSMESSGGN